MICSVASWFESRSERQEASMVVEEMRELLCAMEDLVSRIQRDSCCTTSNFVGIFCPKCKAVGAKRIDYDKEQKIAFCFCRCGNEWTQYVVEF